MTKLVGVILAGGLSRRMGGGDKSVLRLDDATLMSHVIARLSPQVGRMVLNANGDRGRFAEYGLDVVPDSIDGFAGPLAGVLAGMDWAQDQGATHVLSVAADTPFFPMDLGSRLHEALARDAAPIALAATPDPKRGLSVHPTFGIWPVALADDLRRALEGGLRKVLAWTDQHGATTEVFEPGAYDPFFNVNTPEDLEKAKDIARTLQ